MSIHSARGLELPALARSVGALVLLALVLRVLFLILAGVNAPLTGDEPAYQQIAENFAAGRGLYQTNNPFFPAQVLYAWQAPLYPLALGILYRLAGVNPLVGKLFGVMVSAATVYVVYDLTRRVFGGDARATRTAWLAAFLVAIYPGLLTNAHLLLSETLFIFLLLLALDWVARACDAPARARWWVAGGGALWGMATLTRGITLYFTPLFAFWIAWTFWRAGANDTPAHKTEGGGEGLRAAGMALLFLAAMTAVIVPWAARNYVQFGQVVLLETKGGVNLWLGNSPYTPNDVIRNVWKVGVRERMLDVLPTDEVQRDRAAYALAIDYIRAEPGVFLARMPVKFADLMGFERNLADTAEATTRGGGWNSLSKLGSDVLAMVVYIFVMVCGIAGLVLAPNRADGANAPAWKLLLGGLIAYYVFAHMVIFGDGRFHLPLVPLFALYGAWALLQGRQARYTLARLLVILSGVALMVGVWAREIGFALRALGNG